MHRTSAAFALVLCWASGVCTAATGQQSGGAEQPAGSAAPASDDQVIVRGQRLRDLRFEVEISREALFDRFNEINSDDRFDIICTSERRSMSHMVERSCSSNDWREQAANYASAVVMQLRGEGGPVPEQFLGAQLHGQLELAAEVRRLVYEDEALYQAVERYAKARMAVAEHTGLPLNWSTAQAVIPDESGLPYGANRMLQVNVGRDRWTYPLRSTTFGAAEISGKLKSVDVECAQGSERLRYEGPASWTLPPEWSQCVLLVNAKAGTKLALFEFD
jgi:hypothetical protein